MERFQFKNTGSLVRGNRPAPLKVRVRRSQRETGHPDGRESQSVCRMIKLGDRDNRHIKGNDLISPV